MNELWSMLGDGATWWGERGLLHRGAEHLRLSLLAVALAVALAVPVAAWLGHVRRGGVVAQWVVNLGRAIPSLAVLTIVFQYGITRGWGLGFWPTLPPLVLLALPPLFTNTYVGVRTVDPDAVDAARGMGLTPRQVLTRVELPAALPIVLAGLRIATLQVVATATLGAFVGFNALGSFLNEGFRQQDDGKLLTGALAVSLLALALDGLLGVVSRWAVPWRNPAPRAAGARSLVPDTKGTPT